MSHASHTSHAAAKFKRAALPLAGFKATCKRGALKAAFKQKLVAHTREALKVGFKQKLVPRVTRVAHVPRRS